MVEKISKCLHLRFRPDHGLSLGNASPIVQNMYVSNGACSSEYVNTSKRSQSIKQTIMTAKANYFAQSLHLLRCLLPQACGSVDNVFHGNYQLPIPIQSMTLHENMPRQWC